MDGVAALVDAVDIIPGASGHPNFVVVYFTVHISFNFCTNFCRNKKNNIMPSETLCMFCEDAKLTWICHWICCIPKVVKAMQEGNITPPSLFEVASHTKKNCHSVNYYYIIRPLKINKMFLVLTFFSQTGEEGHFYLANMTVLTFLQDRGRRLFLFLC
jgi:hypothetical protein